MGNKNLEIGFRGKGDIYLQNLINSLSDEELNYFLEAG